MFPNCSVLGWPAFPYNDRPVKDLSHQQHQHLFHFNGGNAHFHGVSLNMPTPFTPSSHCAWVPVHTQPLHAPSVSTMHRKRRRDGQSPYDMKRQRLSSPTTSVGSFAKAHLSPTSSFPRGDHRARIYQPNPVRCLPAPTREPQYGVAAAGRIPAKDKLSEQIMDLFRTCQQQSDDLEKKERCRAKLQDEIHTVFPYSILYLAGSSLNGFGSRSSDADLCLVIKTESVNQRTDAVHVLRVVQKRLYRLSYIERPQLIHAKVPILKFRDKVSGVEFDLNVNNIVGIRNTFLLRTYAYIENRVRPIILVTKKWALHHGINNASRGTLSSYSLVLMVLNYLQTLPEPVIPCLQREYPESFSSFMELHQVPEGPRGIPTFHSKNQSNLSDLFLGFLKYYAFFNWDKLVISVREAKALSKPSYREWKDKFICIEEPFDRTNTARAVHEKIKFDLIKAKFMESWQLLQQKRDLNAVLPMRAAMERK